MSSFCVSTFQNRQFFPSFEKNEKKLVKSDAMEYQRLPEYQIPFPLFKVNEPWKFQMSSFCISIGETHSGKRAILTISRLFHLYWCKMTFRTFAAHWLWIKTNQFDILEAFGIPLYQIWLIFILFSERRKLPVLDYVFHLYWYKMKTLGNFMAHWLWIKGNKLGILQAFGMPLC